MSVVCSQSCACSRRSVDVYACAHIYYIYIYYCCCCYYYIRCLEILLKLYAYGWDFFKSPWNLFDSIVILVSVIPSVGASFAVMRALRILRTLRLLKNIPKLKIIIESLLHAIPSSLSIANTSALVVVRSETKRSSLVSRPSHNRLTQLELRSQSSTVGGGLSQRGNPEGCEVGKGVYG